MKDIYKCKCGNNFSILIEDAKCVETNTDITKSGDYEVNSYFVWTCKNCGQDYKKKKPKTIYLDN